MENSISKKIFYFIIYSIPIQLCFHSYNYSDIACMAALAGTLLVTATLVYTGGLRDTLVMIALMFITRHVGIASPLKILLGQSLDSHLYHPASSFLMVFACGVEILAAYLLVDRTTFKKTIFPNYRDERLLWTIATVCFLVGVPVSLLTNLTAKRDVTLGGFRTFTDTFLMLGIIARTAYVCLRHGGRKLLDLPLALMLGWCVVFAMLSSVKIMAYTAFVAYSLTFVCFRRSVPPRLVALGVAGLAINLLVLNPLVNSLRGSASMLERPLSERVEALTSFFRTESVFQMIRRHEEVADEYAVVQYFGPVGKFAPFAERIAMVANADVLKSGIDMNGTFGSRMITEAFVGLIPRVLNPKKNMIQMIDEIYWHAGVSSRDCEFQPSVGLIAGSYALAGWSGVFIAPFVLFTLFFALQKLWAGTSCDNIMALFFVVRHVNAVAEFDVTRFILILIRTVPLDLISMLILMRTCEYFTNYPAGYVRSDFTVRPTTLRSSPSV